MTYPLVSLAALLLDKLWGDPRWIPHPVILMGCFISFLERKWNRPPYDGHAKRRLFLGACLTLSTVGLAWLLPFLLLWGLHALNPFLATLVNCVLISTTIAWKGLTEAGQKVHLALATEGLTAARQRVGFIVGRDTENLSSSEVVRATVETLAENIVDAIVSPVFYGCIGGAPLALAYRAANTLDSMVGYKNCRYQFFGRVSARLDDVLNYVPARLTAILLSIAIILSRLSISGAWATLRRDAPRHPSPNAGIPEAMVAGALSVQLGGTNVYQGVVSRRATMGDAARPLSPNDIPASIRLVNLVSLSLITILFFLSGGLALCLHGLHL